MMMPTNPYILGSSAATAGPWVPTDIGGCVFWVRPDLGVTKDGSNLISLWADQSGNGNNVAQGTAAMKPTWVDNQLNGYPVISFAANHVLEGLNFLNGSAGAIFVVGRVESGTINNSVMFASCDEASAALYCLLLRPWKSSDEPNLCISQEKNPVFNVMKLNYTTAFGTFYVFSCGSTGTAYIEHINGTAPGFTVRQGSDCGDWFADTENRDNVTIGGAKWNAYGQMMTGKIAEVIAYDGVSLTPTEFATVENYLNNKYAIY